MFNHWLRVNHLSSNRGQRDKLQRIQNTAARMITGARSSDHITPLLKSLHWLPVEARIHFKIVLITYKILNGQSAEYLEPLIKDYHPSRALRSSSRSLLCTPAIKSKTYWGRAFYTAAPQLWNSTPEYVKNADSVTTFKTKLKTFLFRKFFNWNTWLLIFMCYILRFLKFYKYVFFLRFYKHNILGFLKFSNLDV